MILGGHDHIVKLKILRPANAIRSAMKAAKFYAVRSGRTPGIYQTWEDCKTQVSTKETSLLTNARKSPRRCDLYVVTKYFSTSVAKTSRLQVTAFSNAEFKSFKTLNEAKSFLSSGLDRQNTSTFNPPEAHAPRQLTLASPLLDTGPSRCFKAIQEDNEEPNLKKRKREQAASVSSGSALEADANEWYHMVCFVHASPPILL